MRLPPERLADHLSNKLAPLYLFSGAETLLVEEAGDLVRQAARRSGCGEREVFQVAKGFDWERLAQASNNLSLFAERRLLEIRLATPRLGNEGGAALAALAAKPPVDTVTLIFAPALDAAAQKTAWVQGIEQHGVWVMVKPVEPAQLPGWIQGRLRQRGLQADREGVAVLAERVEGNLLAAAQEIDKLLLLRGPGAVTADEITAAVADSARYDIYALAEACLAGEVSRVSRIVATLKGEGVELPLVLWVLAKELRALTGIADMREQGSPLDQAMAKAGIWERRRPLVRSALQRLDRKRGEQLLQHAAWVDRLIKGGRGGNPWEGVLTLALGLAGVPLVLAQAY